MKYEEQQKIFSTKGYYILKNENNEYIIYDKKFNDFDSFLGIIKIDKDMYSFNKKRYDTIESLISAINDYNSTLDMPMFMYNPWLSMNYKIELAFVKYLEELGYSKRHIDYWSGTEYVMMQMCNIYGEPISKLTLQINTKEDKEFKGKIVRTIGDGWQWVEASFNGFDDLFAIVNSMIEPEILVNNTLNIQSLERMNKKRNDDLSICCVDNNLNFFKAKAKNLTIEKLEECLNRLKS